MKVLLSILVLILARAPAAHGDQSLRRTQAAATGTAHTVSAVGQVTRLRLINADTNQPIVGYDPLPAMTRLDLVTLSTTNLTIEAITNGTTVGSIQWSMNGQNSTVNYPAWVMCGKNGADFHRCPNLKLGTNATITATPYAGKNATGVAGPAASIRLVIVKSNLPLPLLTLTLVNAATDQNMGPLSNSTVIALNETRKLNVLVTVPTALTSMVRSVTFTNDRNVTRVDNQAPFTFMRTNGSDYFPWTPQVGRRSFVVRAYSEKGGQGRLLAATATSFVVVTAATNGTRPTTLAPVATRAPTRAPSLRPTTRAPTSTPTTNGTDTTPPKLLRLAVLGSPAEQLTRRTVYVDFRATVVDDETGAGYARIIVTHVETGTQWIKAPNGGDETEMCPGDVFKMEASFAVTPTSLSGDYTIAILMRDNAHNEIVIGTNELVARGFKGGFTVWPSETYSPP